MINRQEIEKLAKQLMLSLSDEEIGELIEEFKIFDKHLELLNQVDTSTTEPMVYGRDYIETTLRSDALTDNLSVEDVLENAPSKVDDFFKVTAVVE